MSFTKDADGRVKCDRCGERPPCPPRDVVTVARWRRDHACPPRPATNGGGAA